jgi:hypothetical protein
MRLATEADIPGIMRLKQALLLEGERLAADDIEVLLRDENVRLIVETDTNDAVTAYCRVDASRGGFDVIELQPLGASRRVLRVLLKEGLERLAQQYPARAAGMEVRAVFNARRARLTQEQTRLVAEAWKEEFPAAVIEQVAHGYRISMPTLRSAIEATRGWSQ